MTQNVTDQDLPAAEQPRSAPDQAAATCSTPSLDHPERVPNLVCELLFNQLQHVSLVAMAAAGGILTLLGTSFAGSVKKGGAIIAILSFGVSAFIALLAQNEMVEALADRKPFMKKVKRYRAAAYALLGAGVGAFIKFVSNIVAA